MPDLNGILDRQQRLIQLGVFGVAALVGFAESRADRTVAIVVYLLMPVAAASLTSMWFREIDRMRAIAETSQQDKGAESRLWWSEVERARGLVTPVRAGVVLTTLLSGLLAFREARGIEEGDPTLYDTPLLVLFATAWVGVTVTALWTAFKGRPPRGR